MRPGNVAYDQTAADTLAKPAMKSNIDYHQKFTKDRMLNPSNSAPRLLEVCDYLDRFAASQVLFRPIELIESCVDSRSFIGVPS